MKYYVADIRYLQCGDNDTCNRISAGRIATKDSSNSGIWYLCAISIQLCTITYKFRGKWGYHVVLLNVSKTGMRFDLTSE